MLQGKYRQSADLLNQESQVLTYLRDPQMDVLLKTVIEKNKSKLGTPTDPEFEEWLLGAEEDVR